MKKDCYCPDIERARQLAAQLCLNWKMPLCPFHESKRECGKCDVCGYDYQRYCRQHTPQPDPVESTRAKA